MTREEYLNELRGRLTSLTDDEKTEALQYYSDYFEEADDDQKVIGELGTPEEAAAKIMENFSNALVGTTKEHSDEEKTENLFDNDDKLCFTFEKDVIESLALDLGACHAVAIPGNKWMIETRGIRPECFTCYVSNKTLYVNSIKKLKVFDFFSHERKSRIIPRILVTVPANANLDKVKIQLGAGLLKTQKLSVSAKKTIINIGAGNMIINGLSGESNDIRCGMGNLEVKGNLTGRTNIDCGMGAITIDLPGTLDDYSYDCKVGLGEFRIGDQKYSGVQTVTPGNKKENHISVNCGMGSVNCKLK